MDDLSHSPSSPCGPGRSPQRACMTGWSIARLERGVREREGCINSEGRNQSGVGKERGEE